MLLCMRTTVDLPDELLIAAKKRAAELRRPLRSLIEQGLRNLLNAPRAEKKTIHFVTVKGGLPPGLDIQSREAMGKWIHSPTNKS